MINIFSAAENGALSNHGKYASVMNFNKLLITLLVKP